jgi:hypothetical protein
MPPFDDLQNLIGDPPESNNRKVVLSTQISSFYYSAMAEYELVDQSGDIEDTPIFMTKAHDGVEYYVLFTNRGPEHISAFCWKQTYTEYWGDGIPVGEFVDCIEGTLIDYGSLPAYYYLGGMTRGPLTSTGGEMMFYLTGGETVRTLSWTCADTGGWGWTLGTWKAFDGSEVTGVWYDETNDWVAVSFATGEIRTYEYGTETLVGTVTLAGYKVVCYIPRDDEDLGAATRAWYGIRTSPGFCLLVDETGMQFRSLNMETMEIEAFVRLNDKFTDRWKTVYLHQPMMKAMQIHKTFPTVFPSGTEFADTPRVQPIIYYAGGTMPDAQPFTVEDLIRSLCLKFGYSESALEFVNLDGITCRGWAVLNQTDFRSMIGQICEFFDIIVADTGESTRFIRRVVTAAADINAALVETDLVDRGGGYLVRTEEIVPEFVPTVLEVNYPNADHDWTTGTYEAKRASAELLPGRNYLKTTMSSPVAMTEDEAEAFAKRNLYVLGARRTTHAFSLGPAHLFLEVGDVVTIPLAGEERRAQIAEITIQPDFTLDVIAEEYLRDE